MEIKEKYNIFSYGFKNKENYEENKLKNIARVIKEDKNSYTLILHNKGIVKAMLKGSLYKTATVNEKPCVGDFVFVSKQEKSKYYLIKSIINRKNVLTRAKANKLQAIASNVDYAFVIMSLDEQFNITRLERFLLLLQEQNIKSVILLNKKDLVKDPQPYIDQIKAIYKSTRIYLTSAYQKESLLPLKKYLENNSTVLMIGVSGVGKSSLINAFAGQEVQEVQEVSSFLSKGKHTTVARSIVKTNEGFLFIDIPGIKEVLGSLTEEDVKKLDNEVLNQIEAYASSCKFRNCSHTKEPSCAVLKAVKDNEISKEVLIHYYKIKDIVKGD